EASEASLMLGNELGLEGAVAVAWDVEGEFAEVATNGLRGVAVPTIFRIRRVVDVVRISGAGGERCASEVDVHLAVEHAFEGRLHEGAEEAVEIVESLGLGGDVGGELLDLEFEFCVHSGNLRKEGWLGNLPKTKLLTQDSLQAPDAGETVLARAPPG